MIVIDTDVLIEIFDRKSLKGDEALNRIIKSGEKISITAINLHEILYGLQKYAKQVREVLQLPVLSYTKEDAILAVRLELEAERRGIAIRRTDAMIAAITINNNASLFTFDVKHFGPMQALGLRLFQSTPP
jgi:tRNA(fMet)-specific endonuclease VapC